MWLPFILFGVTVLGCFAAILVGMSVSTSMQVEDYIQLGVVFSPLLLVGVVAARRYWLGLAMGMVSVPFLVPVPIIKGFSMGMIFCGMICMFVLGGVCFRQYQVSIVKGWGAALVFTGALFCLGRVLWDRPGSANLGGEGGGKQALIFLLAFFSFWGFSKIAAMRDWRPMRTMQLALFLAAATLAYRILSGKVASMGDMGADSGGGLIYSLYSRPGWVIIGIGFAWCVYRFAYLKGTFVVAQVFGILSSGLLFLSVVNGHRSRPVFAVCTILAIAYMFREQRKAFLLLAVMVFVGLLALVSADMEKVSPQARRALSIVIPISESEAKRLALESQMNHEVGWESDFRAGMYQIAWDKISGNPVFGAGFSFSRDDLIRLMNSMGSNQMENKQAQLAMSGAYHNAFLFLAVGAGLPAALFSLSGALIILYQFFKFGVRMVSDEHRFFCAALVGMFMPVIGQSLMNGAGNDFFHVFMLLGVMNGLMNNPYFRKDGDPEPLPEPVHEPKLAEGDIPAGFGGPLKW
jgi:hypothetical protein